MLEELLLTAVSDPDANAWANTVQGAGGFVTGPQRRRAATLIRSLKAAGVWPLLDRLWLFAAENPTQALIDLKARATATLAHVTSTDPTFVVNRGFLGNVDGYVNTGFNPVTGAGNYARDNARFGAWAYQLGTVNNYSLMGNEDGNTNQALITPATPCYRYGVNTASLPNSTTAATGLAEFERTAAGAEAAYLNGAANGTDTGASIAMTSQSFFVLATNSAGSPVHVGNFGVSVAFMGASLSTGQRAANYAAMRTYMTAVGVP